MLPRECSMYEFSVQGEPILPSQCEGLVGTDVLVGDKLTVELARRGLALGARVIVTQSGNFACHGANILRAARSAGVEIGWTRGLILAEGSRVHLTPRGACSSDRPVSSLSGRAAEPTEFYRYTGRHGWSHIALWPHRRYSSAEADLLIPGLSLSASRLSGAQVHVGRDRFGYLWFSRPCLTNAGIAALAASTERAWPLLREMVVVYDDIWSRLAGAAAGDHPPLRLPRALVDQFIGHHLLLHRTYGQVLNDVLGVSDVEWSEGARARILVNPVVDWLKCQTGDFTSRKTVDDKAWGLRVPSFSPSESLRSATDHTTSELRFAYWVAVLKEWKFVLTKNVYSLWGTGAVS